MKEAAKDLSDAALYSQYPDLDLKDFSQVRLIERIFPVLTTG